MVLNQDLVLKKYLALSLLAHLFLFGAVIHIQPKSVLPISEPYVVNLIDDFPLQENITEVAKRPQAPAVIKSKPVPAQPKASSKRESNYKNLIPLTGDIFYSQATIPDTVLPLRHLPLHEVEGKSPLVEQSGSRPLSYKDLFDKEVIAQEVDNYKATEKAQSDSITFKTADIAVMGYMRNLKMKVEYEWKYPRRAIENNIYGDLIIEFVILKDGTLGSVEVLRTSGQRMLDDAAVKGLRKAEPYWPLPKGWNKESITIRGRFIYTLNGNYIR